MVPHPAGVAVGDSPHPARGPLLGAPGVGRCPDRVPSQPTGADCSSIAARMRATDSASGVAEVSTTTSARAGGS